MESEFESRIKKMDKLDVEIDEASREKTLAELKRAEKEAKKTEGKGWRKALGIIKSIRPKSSEELQDFYGMGMGNLREMNNPRSFRK